MAPSSTGCLPSLFPISNLLQSEPRARWDHCYLSLPWEMLWSYSTSSALCLDQMTQIRQSSIFGVFFFCVCVQGAFIHSLVHSFTECFLRRDAWKKAGAFQEIWAGISFAAAHSLDAGALPHCYVKELHGDASCSPNSSLWMIGSLLEGEVLLMGGRALGGANEYKPGLCPSCKP